MSSLREELARKAAEGSCHPADATVIWERVLEWNEQAKWFKIADAILPLIEAHAAAREAAAVERELNSMAGAAACDHVVAAFLSGWQDGKSGKAALRQNSIKGE